MKGWWRTQIRTGLTSTRLGWRVNEEKVVGIILISALNASTANFMPREDDDVGGDGNEGGNGKE